MATVEPDDELVGGLLGGPRADATVLRMLGNQLRRLREAAGVTPDQAGYEIRASRSKISRMENGRVGFKGRDVAGQLTLYGVTGEQTRAGMLELARQASTRAGGRSTATSSPTGSRYTWAWRRPPRSSAPSSFSSCTAVPDRGLCPRGHHARQSGRTATEVDRRLGLRMKRQDLLAGPDSPRVWSVMDEAALRRSARKAHQ